jgi:hypothetical protein
MSKHTLAVQILLPPLLVASSCVSKTDFVWSGDAAGDAQADRQGSDAAFDAADGGTGADVKDQLQLHDKPGQDLRASSDLEVLDQVTVPDLTKDVGDGLQGPDLPDGTALPDAADLTDGTLLPDEGKDLALPDQSQDAGPEATDGTVEAEACTPQCVEKQCGPDGCNGSCWQAEGPECDDGNPCTSDACNEGSCKNEVLPLAEILEDLEAGKCLCKEKTDCTALEDGDACNGILTCAPSPSDEGINVCQVEADSVKKADDGLWCNGEEGCDKATGELIPGTPPETDDGLGCTADECDEETDQVKHTPQDAVCDDQDPCTADLCDVATGCSNPPVESAPCDDNDLCTGKDLCDAKAQCQGVPLASLPAADGGCDDGNVCTEHACSPDTGGCITTFNSLPCEDADPCTVFDQCNGAGECVGTPKSSLPVGQDGCDDADPCTDDGCKGPLGACAWAFNSAPCEDGNPCTVQDTCSKGGCKPGPWNPCDDANVCTKDTCNPDLPAGCLHDPAAGGCDDLDLCTKDDTCAKGQCAGAPYDCSDGLDCTDDVCDGKGGCDNPLSAGHCLIDSACRDEGQVSPDNPCLSCQPETAANDWSSDDTLICGPLPEAASVACEGGLCTVVTCNAERGDCNGVPADGCETDTSASLSHCGQCGKPCGAGQVCSLGSCKNECDGGLTNCPPLGCVSLSSNPDHCGGCDKKCQFGHAKAICLNSGCQLDLCDPGWADGNGKSDDGCECPLTNGGVEACNGGDDDCDGMVDDVAPAALAADPVNCGKCGTACASADPAKLGSCSGSQCGLSPCSAGTWNLDGAPANGCEYACTATGAEACNGKDDDCDGKKDEGFDLFADVTNCGACGKTCFHATALKWKCDWGKCRVEQCAPGLADLNKDPADGCEAPEPPLGEGDLYVDDDNAGDPAPDGTQAHPFPTIQQALAIAKTGAYIHVAAGYYTGPIEIKTEGITVEGESMDQTFVSTSNDKEYVVNVMAPSVSVKRLDVSGSQNWGIRVSGSPKANIEDCRVHHINTSLDFHGTQFA